MFAESLDVYRNTDVHTLTERNARTTHAEEVPQQGGHWAVRHQTWLGHKSPGGLGWWGQ